MEYTYKSDSSLPLSYTSLQILVENFTDEVMTAGVLGTVKNLTQRSYVSVL